MRARRLVFLATVVAAVLVPSSVAFADTLPPPGTYMQARDLVCGTDCWASIDLNSPKGGPSEVCLSVFTPDGLAEGCTTTIGTVLRSGKYLVGFTTTTVSVSDGVNPPHDVVISVSATISGPIVHNTYCSVPTLWRVDSAPETGLTTIDGITESAAINGFTVATRTVKKC